MSTHGEPLAAPQHDRVTAQFSGPELTDLHVEQRLGRLAAATPTFRNTQTKPQAAFDADDAGLMVRQSPQEHTEGKGATRCMP